MPRSFFQVSTCHPKPQCMLPHPLPRPPVSPSDRLDWGKYFAAGRARALRRIVARLHNLTSPLHRVWREYSRRGRIAAGQKDAIHASSPGRRSVATHGQGLPSRHQTRTSL